MVQIQPFMLYKYDDMVHISKLCGSLKDDTKPKKITLTTTRL